MANIYERIADPTQGKLGDIGTQILQIKQMQLDKKQQQKANQLAELEQALPIAKATDIYTKAVLDKWKNVDPGIQKDPETWRSHKKSIYNAMPKEMRPFLPNPDVDKLSYEQFQGVQERAKQTLSAFGEAQEQFGPMEEIIPETGIYGQREKTTGEYENIVQKKQALVQNVIGEKAFPKTVEIFAKKLINDDMPKAESAARSISTTNEMVGLLDKGMFTGTAAEFQTWLGGALQKAGFSENDDRVANTQAYAAFAGNQVAQIIKEFGAGTGLSDADREYAEKIAGGKITLTPEALRKLHRLNVQYSRKGIERYNKNVSRLPKSIRDRMDLSINVPEPYEWEQDETEIETQPQQINVREVDW